MIFVAQIGIDYVWLCRRCMWNRTPRAGQFRGWTPLVHSRTDLRRRGVLSDGNLGEPPEIFVYTAIPAWIMMHHDGSWFMIPLLNWPLDATWIFLNHTESPTCLSREKTPGGDSPIMEYHGSPLFLRVKNAFVLLIHTGRSGRGSMLRGLLLQGSYAGARTFQWDRGGQGGQTKQGKLWMLAQLVIGDVPAAKI